MKFVLRIACILALLCALPLAEAAAQQVDPDDLPEEVRRELDRRGLTVEEAMQEARRLGIDPSNPEQAQRRARELGIPESQIRMWMRLAEAMEEGPAQQQADSLQEAGGDRRPPQLAGRSELVPDEITLPRRFNRRVQSLLRGAERRQEQRRNEQEEESALEEEEWWLSDSYRESGAFDQPRDTARWGAEEAEEVDTSMAVDSVRARVPLQEQASGIGEVHLMLLSPSEEDTLQALNVRRVLGSDIEGVWQGTFYIPPELESGEWRLQVIAANREGSEAILPTEATLEVISEDEDPDEEGDEEEEELTYFGYDIFEQAEANFDPGSSASADEGYVVSPGDELRLMMWGASELQYDLQVDLEGRIFIPTVGQFTVAGRRLGDLRNEMKNWLSQNYSGLTSDPPSVFMDLTLTRLRPSQVYVLGEVERPGGYTLPSGSSVFNALYRVGGPNTSGSLRDVRIVRNGEIIARVDLYEFLLEGSSSEEVSLQSNDYVFVPPRGTTVAIDGEVRRPAIYELLPEESAAELIEYAGGLKPEAYTKRFHIERVVPFAERTEPSSARTVIDANLTEVLEGEESVPVEDGDSVEVLSIVEEGSAAGRSRVPAVSVGGAVYSPGQYELNDEVRTVRDLVEAADGLTGDAHLRQAELIRLGEDLESEVIALNLEEVMDDEPTANLVLRPQDSLRVFSNLDLRGDRLVTISGEVLNPGDYELHRNMTVQDLLYKGGGLEDSEFLKDVFLARADLFRQSDDGDTEEIIPFDLGAVLEGTDDFAEMELEPDDEIRIYPARVERLEERYVTVSGAVNEPGEFRYFDGMTLEDLLLQAEGFREDAYMMEIEVTRARNGSEPVGNPVPSRVESKTVSVRGSDEDGRFQFVADDETGAALNEAREFELEHRDRVFVRPDPDFEMQETVNVAGEVRFPGEYTLLHDSETLSEVLDRAGGLRQSAHPDGGRLMRDDEQVIVEMDRALEGDAGGDVVLQAGDEIVIPPQPNTVAVRGNVANDGQLRYESGKRVSYYIDRAGGERDRTEAIYLTQPSGATYRVETGWFRSTPIVKDGATIVVEREPERDEESFDLTESLSDMTSILTSALTIIVLSRRALD